jgi:hypothetical protein
MQANEKNRFPQAEESIYPVYMLRIFPWREVIWEIRNLEAAASSGASSPENPATPAPENTRLVSEK